MTKPRRHAKPIHRVVHPGEARLLTHAALDHKREACQSRGQADLSRVGGGGVKVCGGGVQAPSPDPTPRGGARGGSPRRARRGGRRGGRIQEQCSPPPPPPSSHQVSQNPRNPNKSTERIGKIPETQRIGRTNRRSRPNSAADLGEGGGGGGYPIKSPLKNDHHDTLSVCLGGISFTGEIFGQLFFVWAALRPDF